jgi:hypothetical protein
MRIPLNTINTEKYTIGKEFIFESTYKEYQGYYYEYNNKTFVGREFNPKALRLLKLGSSEVNPLKLNPATSVYANLKEIKIYNNKIPSIPFQPIDSGTKYLAKQLNSNPIRIVFTTKDAWENSNIYPEYIFTSIDYQSEFGFDITEENVKAIPEIRIFLSEYSNVNDPLL